MDEINEDLRLQQNIACCENAIPIVAVMDGRAVRLWKVRDETSGLEWFLPDRTLEASLKRDTERLRAREQQRRDAQ
jgi:hypothetical protein